MQHRKEQFDYVQQELTTTLREQAELNQQLEAQRVEFDNDRHILEATIAELGTVEDRAYASQKSIQEDLRRQAQLAQVGITSPFSPGITVIRFRSGCS